MFDPCIVGWGCIVYLRVLIVLIWMSQSKCQVKDCLWFRSKNCVFQVKGLCIYCTPPFFQLSHLYLDLYISFIEPATMPFRILLYRCTTCSWHAGSKKTRKFPRMSERSTDIRWQQPMNQTMAIPSHYFMNIKTCIRTKRIEILENRPTLCLLPTLRQGISLFMIVTHLFEPIYNYQIIYIFWISYL